MSNTKLSSQHLLVKSIIGNLPAGSPLQAMRKQASEDLNSVIFPTLRDEAWKYTRVSGLLRKSFTPSHEAPKAFSENIESLLENQSVLTFSNGFYNDQLSAPNLESARPLSSVAEKEIPENMPDSIAGEQDAFGVLNKAGFTDGALIKVGKNKQEEKPLYLVHTSTGNETGITVRHYLHLEEGAAATVVLLFNGEGLSFSNVLTSVEVGRNAQLTLIAYHLDGAEANTINSIYTVQHADSRLHTGSFVLGGKLVRQNVLARVAGSNCDTQINGAAVLNAKQQADFRVVLDHEEPNCTSNQVFKNVMSHKATGVFNGKIYVRPDAQQINAFQSNQNILLSDDANAYARPQLEIYADDVKCSHGSTTGQLNEEAVFYLMSRGIAKREAEKMLISAFTNDALSVVADENLREHIAGQIHQKGELL